MSTKIKKVFSFFKVPDNIAKIAPKVAASIAGGTWGIPEDKLKIVGVKGVSYRGAEFFYLAYQTMPSNQTKRSINELSQQYKQIKKLRDALGEIEMQSGDPRRNTQYDEFGNFLGEHRLKDILGTSTLDITRLRKREKQIFDQIQSHHDQNKKVYYAFFEAGATSRHSPIIHSKRDTKTEVKLRIKDLWNHTPAGRKAYARNQKKRQGLAQQQRRTPYGVLTLVGGVHTTPGDFIRLHESKMRNILNNTKKPMSNERHIGVEIEASIPRTRWDELKTLLSKNPLAQYMCLGTDGSVFENDSYKGGELRLCAPTTKIGAVVTAVCEALVRIGARVDKTCGLHVHLDARPVLGVKPVNMFNQLVQQQMPLYLTQPASRRGNAYCKFTREDDWGTADRYKTINPESFEKYNTVEVRLHSGTIIASKIINWIMLLEMIAYGEELAHEYKTVGGLLNALDVNGELREYFMDRAAKFKSAPKPVTSSDEDDYTDFTDNLSSSEETEEDWPLDDFSSDEQDDSESVSA